MFNPRRRPTTVARCSAHPCDSGSSTTSPTPTISPESPREGRRLVLSADSPDTGGLYDGEVRELLRSVWREPAVPDAPGGRVWRDWVLVGCLIPIALLEGILAPDVVWRPFSTIVAIALVPTLLWRRTHPLAMVLVAFGSFIAIDSARLVAGVDAVGLSTLVFVLVVTYSLTRWGSGRQIVLGVPPMLVAASMAVTFDYTGPADAIGGFSVLGLALAAGAVVRYQGKERVQALEEVRTARARTHRSRPPRHRGPSRLGHRHPRPGRARHRTPHPAAATEALAVIEAEAGRTLAEMRTMVGLLRRDDAVDLAPLPEIADLARLGDDPESDAEPPVRVHLDGDLDDLHPTVSTALYRLAQESITNARRHARHASRIDVSVIAGDEQVHLEVRDDGEFGGPTPEPGFGLVGHDRAGDPPRRNLPRRSRVRSRLGGPRHTAGTGDRLVTRTSPNEPAAGRWHR